MISSRVVGGGPRRTMADITLPEGRGSLGLPVVVMIADRLSTRSGAMAATCCEIIPPIEMPTK